MKTAFFRAFAAVVMVASLMAFSLPVDEYNVDQASSELKWTGYHLAKSYSHWGTIAIKSGKINWDGEGIESGEFTIDMTSIASKDQDKESGRTKLDGHLKSEDFFAVDQFPEAKLVIKKTTKKTDNVFTTVADLTIKGITKEIAFDTNIKKISANELEASADFRVKRTDFNVMYGWSLENAMLDGEFRMEVNIVAKK